MNDDERRIIISKFSEYRQTNSPFNQDMPGSRANRWIAFLVLIPIAVIMVALGAFFFAVFLALFAVAAAVFGARLWWLRRKLRKTVQSEEAKDVAIEDAEIIEETKIRHKKNI